MRQWQVEDVMTTEVLTVGVETPYRAVVGLLAERGVSGIPVVDSLGRLQGTGAAPRRSRHDWRTRCPG